MNDDIRRIADHYGKAVHRLKCCEECAELIQAILKGNVKDILSEVADVRITLEELCYHYGLAEEEIEEAMRFKIGRQLARMERESGKQP